MVVQCSEDAKAALNHIAFRKKTGSSPVHTIEAVWPMQRCPVQAQLSRERPLSLLEKYTLRAFNEIPDVSAAEIAMKLGLKEPELIQETLDSLIRAEAIQTSSAKPDGEDTSELQEELERLQLGLETDAYRGAVRRNLQRKVERLQAQIEQQANPKRMSMRQKIAAGFQRLLGFKAKVTIAGRDQLSKGKIVEPTQLQSYDLARCLGTNKLLMVGGDGGVVNGNHLQKFSQNDWTPVNASIMKPSMPGAKEVQQALQAADGSEQVNILRLEQVAEYTFQHQLQICITLSVSHEDGSPVFAVHRKGSSSKRLSWIEAFLAENEEAEALLLKRFEEEMRIKTKVQSTAKPHQIEPMVSAMAHIKRNISSSSKSMLLLNQHDALLNEISSKDDYASLIQNRTIVTYPQNLKNTKVKSQDHTNALLISIPASDTNVPKHTIASQDFMLQLAEVSVLAKHNDLEVRLPVVIFDEDQGNEFLSEANTYLRKEVKDTRERYLFTRSMPDFTAWLKDEVLKAKAMKNLAESYRKALDLGRGSTFNIFQMFMDEVFAERMDFFEPDVVAKVAEFMEQFSEIQGINDCWSMFEPKLQQSIFESVLSEGSSHALSDAWRAHASGEKLLPWEDAARLEHAWVGHCDNTKFNASRFFEETVLELAGSKDMTTENVAKALSALKGKSVLSEDLFTRADRARRERNHFTHNAGLKADLDYTLRLISIMREVAALGQAPDGGRWKAEVGTEWSSALTVSESEAYVQKASSLLKKNGDQSSNGNVWVGSLMQSLPLTVDQIPFGLMEQLLAAPELTTGHQFKDVLTKLVERGLDIWVKNLDSSDNFELPESIRSLMVLLETAGMERELANLKESYLKGLEKLTTYEDLQREFEILEGNDLPFTREEFSIRWKRSVKDSKFKVSFENLASMTLAQFDLLTDNVKSDLFMRAVRTELNDVKDGDVKSVKSLCDELQTFAGKGSPWNVVAKEKDGFSASEMDSKIRAGGNPMDLGPIVESLMPFVDAKSFPKMNARFEVIIERGKKQARKLEEDEK
jgi:hypothetical protein